MTSDERLELDIIFAAEREQRITVTAAKSKPEHREPVNNPQDDQEEYAAVVSLLESLQPWQRRAINTVCGLIDRGIIQGSPRTMARDIIAVIDAFRPQSGGAA
jgi:hypothetical protein